MRTVIKGKDIELRYYVNPHQKEVTIDGKKEFVYFAQPVLCREPTVTWSDIAEFDGELKNGFEILLSENERVSVLDKKFRVDLSEYQIFVNKTLSETETNREEAEKSLKMHKSKFNKSMIESNEKLKNYCEVHRLDVEDTDVFKLWKIVYPENDYSITDGKMIVVPAPNYEKQISYDMASCTSISSTSGCSVLSRYDF